MKQKLVSMLISAEISVTESRFYYLIYLFIFTFFDKFHSKILTYSSFKVDLRNDELVLQYCTMTTKYKY